MRKRPPPIPWAPRPDAYERACASLRVSYMSDAKWRKALGAIADASPQLVRASWKFIDEDRTFDWGVPERRDLSPSRLADGRFQPEGYRWIEWIHFPRRWRPIPDVGHTVSQDLEGLRRALDAIGRFQYVEEERGLTLFGYGR